jgi:hypothetical protein
VSQDGVQIITDAELVNKLAAQITEEPEQVVETKAPIGPEVTLPGGFIETSGEVVKIAEVRELNGVDEEAIANASSTGRALNLLLQRGLVKIGHRDATRDDLEVLLSGDRDAILLAIRKVTFGETVEYEIMCPSCRAEHTVVIDLTKDVPVVELDKPEDRTWTMDLKSGIVTVALPTGITQRKLLENSDKTAAEMNTILLSGCVLKVNSEPSIGASTVLRLGMSDRAKIVAEIIKRNPGPRLGEVKKACEACGEDIDLPLSLVDLFRV